MWQAWASSQLGSQSLDVLEGQAGTAKLFILLPPDSVGQGRYSSEVPCGAAG